MSVYHDKNDEQLIAICLNDDVALEALIKRYMPIVEVIASKYFNSPVDRDDLIQEGVLGCLSGIYSYDASKTASVKTYLNICIERNIINAVRKVSRKMDFPSDKIVPLEDEFIGDSVSADTPEDYFIAKEAVNHLTALIENNLSKSEVEVLRLHMVGLSYAQISQRLNKSAKAVDNALQRARNKLHKLVQ